MTIDAFNSEEEEEGSVIIDNRVIKNILCRQFSNVCSSHLLDITMTIKVMQIMLYR